MIIEPEPNTYYIVGQLVGGILLPLLAILMVILHFRDDKNIYLYTILMILLFITTPSWFIVAIGLALIGLDKVSKFSKGNMVAKK